MAVSLIDELPSQDHLIAAPAMVLLRHSVTTQARIIFPGAEYG